METDPPIIHKVPLSKKELRQVLFAAVIAFTILMASVIGAYRYAKRYTSYVILPGGSDAYYGEPEKPQQKLQSQAPPNKFFADNTIEWVTQKGTVFSYAFFYPKSMKLGVFPGDPHDPVTIFWEKTNSQETIFFRVELLDTHELRKYIQLPKRQFVENWYKQYGYKGVASYTEITNKQGLKGYRISYADASGNASKYHFFFEVPGRPDIMLWMSSDIIDWSVFERMVESLRWDTK